MNYTEKILRIAKENNGYISTRILKEHDIHRRFLSTLCQMNKLKRLDRGLYIVFDYVECPYYITQYLNSSSIYSLETALYLHGLSDRIPVVLNMTVENNYGGNLIDNLNVSLNYVKKDTLNIGVSKLLSPANMAINVYDIDKTICDIIKYKSKVDPEIFSRALQRYVTMNNKNITKLYQYAKIMNVEENVSLYLEVLL